MKKLKPIILRHNQPTEKEKTVLTKNPIYLVLDGVMDTYNIGSLFRLADATGVTKMYITGEVEYPPNSRIHKAAVGTENWVAWVRYKSAPDAVKELKRHGVQIIAVEQDSRATSYLLLATKVKFPVAIVVGHETNGISKEVLDMADLIVELPMYGINNSLNVWGSATVILYKILENI